jgi:hypothetical protein
MWKSVLETRPTPIGIANTRGLDLALDWKGLTDEHDDFLTLSGDLP